jgi:hypothetical protein
MLPHPIIQQLLAWVCKRVSATASDSPQLNCELNGEQATKRASKRRALRVSEKVRSESLPQVRFAWRSAIERRTPGCNPDIQECMLTNSMAPSYQYPVAIHRNRTHRHLGLRVKGRVGCQSLMRCRGVQAEEARFWSCFPRGVTPRRAVGARRNRASKLSAPPHANAVNASARLNAFVANPTINTKEQVLPTVPSRSSGS